MKKTNLIVFIAAMGFLLSGCSNSRSAVSSSAKEATITYQDFYDDLSPYGNWINYAGYGSVWSPNLGFGFRPYATGGRWVYSDWGWMWYSDFSWGWAPFHYGRWLYDDIYGWLWVPGYEWSPAWVTWGYFGNYYCWAPLMPGVNVGVAYNHWVPHSIYWNVVNKNQIYDHNISTELQPQSVVGQIHSDINIINNFNHTSVHNQFYSKGPELTDVQHYVTQPITQVALHNVKSAEAFSEVRNLDHINQQGVKSSDIKTKTSQQNQLEVFRPEVRHAQPREYRDIENNTAAHPIISPSERPVMGQRSEQIENINRLPMRRTPDYTLPTPRMSEPMMSPSRPMRGR